MSKHHPGMLSALIKYHSLTPNIDLIMCRRQPGIGMLFIVFLAPCTRLLNSEIAAIGRLCEKCDGKWSVPNYCCTARNSCLYFSFFLLSSPVCDSYVRPETLVRICDECNFGTYGGRCIICGAPGKSLIIDNLLRVY